jgi:hypothetical protein
MHQQLSGRLGNQLFEWAYAHKLAARYNRPVQLFHDRFHLPNPGDDLTDSFFDCCHQVTVGKSNFLGFILKSLDFLSKRIGKIDYLAERLKITRSKNSYELPKLTKKRPRIVSGFCINKLVVEEFEGELEKDLSLFLEKIELLIPVNLQYQVIHVRKGDYLTSDTSYGVLSPQYYSKNFGPEKVSVLVTDDPDGAQEIADQLHPNYVFTPRNSTAWETLKIMQHSNRLLMANSTLSWWGGFLASRRGGVVISPSPFYSKLDEETNSKLQTKRFTVSSSEFVNPL